MHTTRVLITIAPGVHNTHICHIHTTIYMKDPFELKHIALMPKVWIAQIIISEFTDELKD